jgi:hypothetical protein
MRRCRSGLFASVLLPAVFSFGGWFGGDAAAADKPLSARGETAPIRWVSAYDPRLQVKPPTMKAVDGSSRNLVIDGDFVRRAEAFTKANPGILRAEGGIALVGEVVVVEGGADTLMAAENGAMTPNLAGVARKVIAKYGDNFQAMTFWLTFDDPASRQAEAYEFTVKADVRGLGMQLRDVSGTYGSNGVLRSILNMKRVWGRVGDDSLVQWRPHLETWGQESGHRWMMFMRFVDRRTGLPSDALLGRDCGHYHRLVETQNSVHDGVTWKDNGDGSFTTPPGQIARFGNLDLYGMGLIPADEVPPFFFIDEVPGYTRPRCTSYANPAPPARQTLNGKRVDVAVEDIIAAEGRRYPAAGQLLAGQPQDYFREVQVVLTKANETAETDLVQRIAQRVDKARVLWEAWMREATGRRMVVCTSVTKDCGDARSDVTEMRMNPGKASPLAGLTTVEAVLTNGGSVMATGIEARLDAVVNAQVLTSTKAVGTLAPGQSVTVPLTADFRALPCGTPVVLKAYSQSETHQSRLRRTEIVGAEVVFSDGFEADSGWLVNPEQLDTSMGAPWERGTPAWSEIEPGQSVQLEGAHTGLGAFVTGAAAFTAQSESYVRAGRTTLESPTLDATAWREPKLRYWLSFASLQGASGGIVASPNGRIIVQAKRVGGGATDAGAPSDWIEVDRVENLIGKDWMERLVALPAGFVGGPVKLRFVAEDANERSGGVEAAIDDVEILSHIAACYAPPPAAGGDGDGDNGGGCGMSGATKKSSGFGILGLALAAFALWRRRSIQ